MLFILLGLFSVAANALLTQPLAPSQDPFYNVPANISAYKNGDIVSWRETPSQLRSVYFPLNVDGAWQFLIRSEDSHGNPTAFVTTVIRPYNAIPSKVLSYQAFEDSASLGCSPSYSVLYGASMATIGIQIEVAMMNIGLSKNWYIVLPDYEGPRSAFTAGAQAGKATLDSIRAALDSSDITGIKKDAEVGLYGFSGGSIPVGWAAQLQPDYAPELKNQIVGAAAGGFVTNLTLTAVSIDGTSFSGISVAAFNGLLQEYPELQNLFQRVINLNRLDLFYEAKSLCLKQLSGVYKSSELFTGQNPWIIEGLGFFGIPQVKKVLHDNILGLQGARIPEVPFFIFHGEKDEVVPIEQPQRVFEYWCSGGAPSVEFAVSNSTGHVLEGATGLGAAFSWLEKRFDGYVPVQGCQRTVRQSNLEYPGAMPNYQRLLSTFVGGIFGEKIGEGESDDSWLAKVLAFILSDWLGLTAGKSSTQTALASNSLKPLKGLGDVVSLWEKEGINPQSVIKEARV